MESPVERDRLWKSSEDKVSKTESEDNLWESLKPEEKQRALSLLGSDWTKMSPVEFNWVMAIPDEVADARVEEMEDNLLAMAEQERKDAWDVLTVEEQEVVMKFLASHHIPPLTTSNDPIEHFASLPENIREMICYIVNDVT